MRSPLPMLRFLVALVAMSVALATQAQAQAPAPSLDVAWSSRELVVGETATIELNVRNGESVGDPVLPQVTGLTFRAVPGRHTIQQTNISNGRSETVRTTQCVVEVSARRAGRFTVPAISIEVDGAILASDPTTVVVRAADASDGGVPLFVDITADPRSPMVGQPTTMTLRIWVRPFRDPQQNIKLDERSMWQFVDLDRSKLGLFKRAIEEIARRNRRPVGEIELRQDLEYYVYSLPIEYRASRAGAPELGEIEIVFNEPTGVRLSRDLFDRRSVQVTGVRSVTAAPTLVDAEIRPLPSDGVPEFFNGAVGRFTVSASAKPTQVSVGDPITVTLTVASQTESGESALEELLAPPFASMPELTKEFRIPTDPIAGKVSGRLKVFTQTFRPVTDGATQIPAIPFSFFDPLKNEYTTVRTAAIPITVSPAERLNLSQIVGGESSSVARPETTLTAVSGGLLANAPASAALLADNRVSLSAPLALAIAVPPLACAVFGAIATVRRRRAADPLRQRAARAARTALARLTPKSSPEDVLASLAGYVADRCGLPDGARTRVDALAALDRCGVPAETTTRVDRLLARCERSRFAPAGADAVSIDEARELVRGLERERLTPKEAKR